LVSASQLELERSESHSERGKKKKRREKKEEEEGGGGGRRKTHPFLGSLHVTTQL